LAQPLSAAAIGADETQRFLAGAAGAVVGTRPSPTTAASTIKGLSCTILLSV
jgi:hypothetical protein